MILFIIVGTRLGGYRIQTIIVYKFDFVVSVVVAVVAVNMKGERGNYLQ